MPAPIYVLIFNARTDNEGIHSLQIGDQDVILMFAEKDDAERYAMMLEAQDLPLPSVEEFDPEEISQFCEGAGYECILIEKNMHVIPPEKNLAEFDWDPDSPTTADRADGKRDDGIDYDRIRRQLEGLL